MQSFLPFITLFLLAASANAQPGNVELMDLEWLKGTWRSPSFEATYTSPESGVILGVSKERRGDSIAFFEFEKFEVRSDSVIMTPFPDGRKGAEFRLVDFRPGIPRAHFQNLLNDYPTDITYALTNGNGLTITVEGLKHGKKDRWVIDLEQEGLTVLRKEALIRGPIDSVWWALTTSEGLSSFFSKGGGNIDLRPWGIYEIWMNPDGEPGRRGMDSMTIIALDSPNRLSISWRNPPSGRIRTQPSYLDIRLKQLAPRETLLLVEQCGWDDSAEGRMSARAQKNLLDLIVKFLARRFEEGPMDWDHPPLPPGMKYHPRPGSAGQNEPREIVIPAPK